MQPPLGHRSSQQSSRWRRRAQTEPVGSPAVATARRRPRGRSPSGPWVAVLVRRAPARGRLHRRPAGRRGGPALLPPRALGQPWPTPRPRCWRAPRSGDEHWRPALELALGHSLAELDRFDEAVPHLERGLLLQAALRHASGEGDRPVAGEAQLRHVLGYAYARTGRTGGCPARVPPGPRHAGAGARGPGRGGAQPGGARRDS